MSGVRVSPPSGWRAGAARGGREDRGQAVQELSDQPVQPFPVGGFDTDAGVQAKPAAVIPGEHVLGVVELQEAVAAAMPRDPGADRMLEALQELGGEGRGFVEAEAGLRMRRILSRVTLNLLEEAVHDAEVIVEPSGPVGSARSAPNEAFAGAVGQGLPQGSLEGPEQDGENRAGGPGPMVEKRPKAFGKGEDPLAHRHVGNDVVHQVSRCLGHALGVA